MSSWYEERFEEQGYVLLAQVEQEDLSYETNEYVVCKKINDDGYLYFGSDSGCSCYEGFDVSELSRGSKQDMLVDFAGWNYDSFMSGNAVARSESLLEQLRESGV